MKDTHVQTSYMMDEDGGHVTISFYDCLTGDLLARKVLDQGEMKQISIDCAKWLWGRIKA